MELRGFEDSPEKERAQRAARQQKQQEQQQQRDRAKKQAASEEAEAAAKKEPQMQQQEQPLSSVEDEVAYMQKYFNTETCNPFWLFSGIENYVANFLGLFDTHATHWKWK